MLFLMYAGGRSKVVVPVSAFDATDCGTGISLRRVISPPPVLITSSSCASWMVGAVVQGVRSLDARSGRASGSRAVRQSLN
tara:strand:+ start:888 stop:1130 length:243 start_codon:yes stop_codon:yes gene_type:complete